MNVFLQIRLKAYDSQYPSDVAYANITITVNRNPNAPHFTKLIYEKTINESCPLGFSVDQIQANDADNVSF